MTHHINGGFCFKNILSRLTYMANHIRSLIIHLPYLHKADELLNFGYDLPYMLDFAKELFAMQALTP
jgi:hypothetical protein